MTPRIPVCVRIIRVHEFVALSAFGEASSDFMISSSYVGPAAGFAISVLALLMKLSSLSSIDDHLQLAYS